MLADRRYCYPLTITDFATRYLLACDALTTTQEIDAFSAFERAFKISVSPARFGQIDGGPFASAHALYGLSKLAVCQSRAAASGARHEDARRAVHPVGAPLPPTGRPPVSAPRLDRHRHTLRPHLLQAPQDQLESGVRGAGCRGPQVGHRVWLVTFMHYDLGHFDDETCRLEPIENPFGPKVLPMCPE